VRRWLRALAGPALLVATAGLMCLWTWKTWPDALIDFGREVYLAWQLSQGAVLHRDVAYHGGPLSPYLNALWFRVFGPGIDTLAGANLVILMGLTALWYRLLEICGDRFSATVGCLSLLLLFAFGRFSDYGSYNFVAPYTHDLTHGVFLSLVAIACLVAHARSGRESWLAGMGLALGLLFLTKLEVFVAATLATSAGLALWLYGERAPLRLVARRIGQVVGAAMLPPLGAGLLLAGSLGLPDAARAVLGGWHTLLAGDVATLGFYRHGMGIDDVSANLSRLMVWSLGYLVLLVPALGAALFLRRSQRAVSLVAVLLAVASFGVLAWFADRILWLQSVRPLPLVILALLAWSLVGCVRRAEEPGESVRWLTRTTLLLLAGGLLAKIVLNARVYHYGFALAMPGVVLIAAAVTGWIPAQLDRAGRAGVAFRAVSLGALSAALMAHLLLMAGFVGEASHAFGRGRDQLLADGARVVVLSQALEALVRRPQEYETLAVLPEGVMLNYLSRRPLAIPHYSFTPFDFALTPEDEILREFEGSPPDLILLIHRETPEYGARSFGRDYAKELYAWVRERYQAVERFGDLPFEPGSRFGAVLMERRAR
jgi:4-amino-4-deoxy-L-arabinose transferase-like glycosyltransferase